MAQAPHRLSRSSSFLVLTRPTPVCSRTAQPRKQHGLTRSRQSSFLKRKLVDFKRDICTNNSDSNTMSFITVSCISCSTVPGGSGSGPPAAPQKPALPACLAMLRQCPPGRRVMNGQFIRLSCQFCPLGNVCLSQNSLLPTCG